MRSSTEKYVRDYFDEGLTLDQIAKKYNVSRSTVCRCIGRFNQYRCPFAANCLNCPLKQCAFKEEWQGIINACTFSKGRHRSND